MYISRPKVQKIEGFDDGSIVKLNFDKLSERQKSDFKVYRILENSLGVIMNYQPDSIARGRIHTNVYNVLWEGKSFVWATIKPMEADEITKIGQITDDEYTKLLLNNLNIFEILGNHRVELQDLPDESSPLHGLGQGGGKKARKSRKSRKVRKSRKARKSRRRARR